jgi:heat shock protein HtpX
MTNHWLRSFPRLAGITGLLAAPPIAVGAVFGGWPGAMLGFALTLVLVALAWRCSHPILLRISDSHVASRESHPELVATVEALASTAGIPVPTVAISDLRAPNAYAAATPGGGIVGVTTGLLDILSHEELEAVLAHEVAHLARGDRSAATVAAVATAIPGALTKRGGSDLFYAAPFRRAHHRTWGGRRLRLVRNGLTLLLVPVTALLVRVSVPLSAEIQADLDAVRLTGNASAMSAALRKLNVLAGRIATPINPAVSHLLVMHPYGSEHLGRLFETHPSLAERLDALAQTFGSASR